MNNSRRALFKSAMTTALLSGYPLTKINAAGSDMDLASHSPIFDVTSSYSADELTLIYQGKHHHSGSKHYSEMIATVTGATTDSVLFYWDIAAGVLRNPYNLKADSTTKPAVTYTINAEVLSFHPSSSVDQNILNSINANLQLVFQTQASDSTGDLLTTITMAGLQYAQEFLSGNDSKLLPVTSNNQLTNVPPSEQIQIVDGEVSLKVSLAGQKKDSFWDNFLKIFQSFANSPVFGLLPIPKLYSTAAQTVATLLNQVEQQQQLVPLLSGKILDFRLYDGASLNPFLFKPGYWIVMNANEAAPHISQSSYDIEDLKLDLPGQLYEMKDKQGNAVDITYCVFRILLPTIQS